MYYSVPPTVGNISVLTNAVANTDTTHVVVAAPGVGSQYRIIGLQLSMRPDMTGLIQVRDLAINIMCEVSPQTPGMVSFIMPPGIQLGDNIALQLVSRSNVAAQSFRAIVHYYIDTTA